MRLAVGGVGDHAQRGELEGEQLVLELGDPGGDQRVVEQRAAADRRTGRTPWPRRAPAWWRPPGRRRRARCRAGTWRSPRPGSPRRRGSRPARGRRSNHTSLTSWPPSISSIGRTLTPGEVMSMSSIEMPACFLTSGSVRTRVKIQSPYWPERGPGLLAVDDVLVAVAYRGGAQRRQVGAGVGLGEALRPPDVEVGGRRQEPLLHLLRAELRDDRADHRGVERQRRRHARALHLLVPDVPAQRRPVLAAPLDGPVRHREPGAR